MNIVTVWLLIAISQGLYNQGSVSTLANFNDKVSCEETIGNINKGNVYQPYSFMCVEAKNVRM